MCLSVCDCLHALERVCVCVLSMCVRVCVCVCARVCVRVCVFAACVSLQPRSSNHSNHSNHSKGPTLYDS